MENNKANPVNEKSQVIDYICNVLLLKRPEANIAKWIFLIELEVVY